MRRYQKRMLVMTGMALFSCYGAGIALAQTAVQEQTAAQGQAAVPDQTPENQEEKGPGIGLGRKNEESEKEQVLMGKIAVASETDSLILVVGQEGADVVLSYHTKDDAGVWTEEFMAEGRYGRNGASSEKREGDKKTPLGTYRFTMAFGVKENPGSILPYHQLTDTDYWVDDPDSRYYNQLVDSRTVKKDWKSAEHMAASVPFYNYGLALDYNSSCVPGKGSAIFLHCMNGEADTGTSGCVKVSEEYMEKLVKSVDAETRIVIVSDISQLEEP